MTNKVRQTRHLSVIPSAFVNFQKVQVTGLPVRSKVLEDVHLLWESPWSVSECAEVPALDDGCCVSVSQDSASHPSLYPALLFITGHQSPALGSSEGSLHIFKRRKEKKSSATLPEITVAGMAFWELTSSAHVISPQQCPV